MPCKEVKIPSTACVGYYIDPMLPWSWIFGLTASFPGSFLLSSSADLSFSSFAFCSTIFASMYCWMRSATSGWLKRSASSFGEWPHLKRRGRADYVTALINANWRRNITCRPGQLERSNISKETRRIRHGLRRRQDGEQCGYRNPFASCRLPRACSGAERSRRRPQPKTKDSRYSSPSSRTCAGVDLVCLRHASDYRSGESWTRWQVAIRDITRKIVQLATWLQTIIYVLTLQNSMPLTEFPDWSKGGDQIAMPITFGITTRRHPQTPDFAGSPTLHCKRKFCS